MYPSTNTGYYMDASALKTFARNPSSTNLGYEITRRPPLRLQRAITQGPCHELCHAGHAEAVVLA